MSLHMYMYVNFYEIINYIVLQEAFYGQKIILADREMVEMNSGDIIVDPSTVTRMH